MEMLMERRVRFSHKIIIASLRLLRTALFLSLVFV